MTFFLRTPGNPACAGHSGVPPFMDAGIRQLHDKIIDVKIMNITLEKIGSMDFLGGSVIFFPYL